MEATTSKRPNRWDEPFGDTMTSEVVDGVLQKAPFCDMNRDSFPAQLQLKDIILNDTRVSNFQEGDIVIREGDYGNSAFLVLDGRVDVSLTSLPESMLGRATPAKRGWLKTIAQHLKNSRTNEFRESANVLGGSFGARKSKDGTRIFLQNVSQVLDSENVVSITNGQLFGELAAFSRSPRTATVIARGDVQLLEIRWQGLRDIIRFDPVLRNYLDHLYRENSLLVHLRETPFLGELENEELQQIADAAVFSSYGEFDWQNHFRKINQTNLSERITLEPLIRREGDYVNDLVLIRNGFARLSREVGHGHQTLAYLGKGEIYGLKEITDGYRSDKKIPFDFSLRAVGHTETITIPSEVVEKIIIPNLSEQSVERLLNQQWLSNLAVNPPPSDNGSEIETGLIEFLGEFRFINGTQTMLIDLDRCTRCDDCVRACAAAHDNNPRFTREGPKFGNQMVASACMHCSDPVCMIGCPTGAIGRDMTTGNILINDQTCIGCSTCANSCPYDNIKMVEISDRRGNPLVDEDSKLPILKATKCDLCSDQHGGPACVQGCPHDAMIRLNTNDATTLNQWVHR